LADALDAFDEQDDDTVAPLPDMREIDGVVYASRPVAIREHADGVAIVRVREVVQPDGTHSSEVNEITLRRADVETIATEARQHGFAPLPSRTVAPTEEHVGSEVVVLRAV
jgi:hypothetical protein